jgi:cytosine/adenosine deaminase-related metal-dependent hydrolase
LKEEMPSGSLLIRNATVLHGCELEILETADMLIEGGIITGIAESGKADFSANGSRVIDGRGTAVIPGFVNAHVHLNDAPLKDAGAGMTLEEMVHPVRGLKRSGLLRYSMEDRLRSISCALEEMARSGITAAIDFHEDDYSIIERLKASLPPASPVVQFLGRPAVYFSEREISGDRKLDAGEVEEGERRLEPFDGIGLSGCNEYSDSALEQIRGMGRGRIIGIHAAETAGTARLSREMTGVSEVRRAVEHLKPDFFVHLTHADGDDLGLISKHAIGSIVCPRSNALFGSGIPPISELIEMKQAVALGTDNLMLNSADMFREMDFASRAANLASGGPGTVDDAEVLKMATINGAKLMSRGRNSGCIEKGGMADLAILDLRSERMRGTNDLMSAIVHRAGICDVLYTVRAGNIIYERQGKRRVT